jgi:hypothetical protein
MPEFDDGARQSPFQGFLGELLDPKYTHYLTLFSMYPQELQEIFMTQKELIYFRNHYIKPNFFLLSPSAVKSNLRLFKNDLPLNM